MRPRPDDDDDDDDHDDDDDDDDDDDGDDDADDDDDDDEDDHHHHQGLVILTERDEQVRDAIKRIQHPFLSQPDEAPQKSAGGARSHACPGGANAIACRKGATRSQHLLGGGACPLFLRLQTDMCGAKDGAPIMASLHAKIAHTTVAQVSRTSTACLASMNGCLVPPSAFTKRRD